MANVYVGLSGGVDSSVTAARLVEEGHTVTGVYMKNWSQDLPGFDCPWERDYQDAKRVATELGIGFKLYDFETEYRQRVVDYMLDGYRAGLTPNPDIMCNQEVKFKLFLETSLAEGADMIATGHYARVQHTGEIAELHTAANHDKDQTYFLYRASAEALSKTYMPIGEFASKAEVRAEAARLGLATARKKDSQGICFVGKVGIKEFLIHELGEQPHGNIMDQHGSIIGKHDGALFYTIGQRQGLGVGGGLPYYVVGKDMTKNEVYVTTDIQDPKLWHRTIRLTGLHWIHQAPQRGGRYHVRTRHRAELVACTWQKDANDSWVLALDEPVRALTPGQSAVVYDDSLVLGGGIVI